MLIQSYKIVEPKRFETFIEDISLLPGEAFVKIDYAAICKADLRYYLGLRDKRILDLKYPISLLHEATGTILKDSTGKFVPGDNVVLVPNIATLSEQNKKYDYYELGENYYPDSNFASSNIDGFSKEIVSFPVSNILKIAKNKYEPVYVFCELISVCISAIRRVTISDGASILVMGDGILGYILCTVLKTIYKCNLTIAGKHEDKLNRFVFCDNRILVTNLNKFNSQYDLAFECVGGQGAQNAINSIIDTIDIGGKIVLTGVSEENISINTRKVLEKGLTLLGTTRSNVKDFRRSVGLLDDENFSALIKKLIVDVKNVKNIYDYYDVYELQAKTRDLGKYVMKM